MTWVYFTLCTIVIVFAGRNLTRYGDIIAARSGLGRTWVGVILVASVTSLPELFAGASAAWQGLQDIAIGEILGSCMFNLLILALLDLLGGKEPVSVRADAGHALGAGFGVLLLGVVCLSLLSKGEVFPQVGWISVYTVVLFLIYLVSIRIIFRYEKWRLNLKPEIDEEYPDHGSISTLRVALMYTLNSAFVVAAAVFLPWIAERISNELSLSHTFVGNIFVALVTSLPEAVVCIAALRIGAVDMAYGNLFGSNLFNVLVLAINDCFYRPGPLLEGADRGQIYPALGAIFMNAVMIIALTTRPRSRTKYILSWDAWFIVLVYAGAIFMMTR